MNRRVTISGTAFSQLVRRLATAPDQAVVCPAGVNRLPDGEEFLVHNLILGAEPNRSVEAAAIFVGAESAFGMMARLESAVRGPSPRPCSAWIAVGIRGAAGNLAGFVLNRGELRALDSVSLVGAGLPIVQLCPGEPDRYPRTEDPAIWRRTIGVLGETAWRRLGGLRFCIIGCGRSGSLLANSLWRFGAHRLTLIDPDTVEPSNLGETDLLRMEDVGMPKVEALAISFRVQCPAEENVPVTAIPEACDSPAALSAARQADVLICCVDNPAARFVAAWLAKVYMKPLLDVGTGILHSSLPERQMGADVRLVMPDHRCLMCFGGVSGMERTGAWPFRAAGYQVAREWIPERSGSLRSLNTIASGLGCRLLEGLVEGRIVASRYEHLEFDAEDRPRLEARQPEPQPSCPLCRLTGHGDGAADSLDRFLPSLAMRR